MSSDELVVRKPESSIVPVLISQGGQEAEQAFFEFFAAEIANPNTREHYMRDIRRFSNWCESRGFHLRSISPIHLAAYREEMKLQLAPPSVKRHFSALRRLFGYWVEKGVLERNPVREVRTEKFSREEGKTLAFDTEDMKRLIVGLNGDNLLEIRDRAIIAVMAYTFARVHAVCDLSIEDYFLQGRRYYLRLHEKGGKERVLPCNHKLEEYLEAYLTVLGNADSKSPLFRSMRGKRTTMSELPLSRTDVYCMVRRRVMEAGIVGRYSCHSFRATGITTFLENGGTLEKAQWMAGHADSRTTKLYDRRNVRASIEDVERVMY